MSGNYDDDDDWHPPTESEMKVLAAKRERSDKISKLMGDYLLKGYKMLATVCRVCGTIELQDRQSQIYCVACMEVDCHETSKDNPALSTQAADQAIAESAYVTINDNSMPPASANSIAASRPVQDSSIPASRSVQDNSIPASRPVQDNSIPASRPVQDTSSDGRSSQGAANPRLSREPPDVVLLSSPPPSLPLNEQPSRFPEVRMARQPQEPPLVRRLVSDQPRPLALGPSTSRPQDESLRESLETSLSGVVEKLCWASRQLGDTENLDQSLKIVTLVKQCADTVVSLRTAIQS